MDAKFLMARSYIRQLVLNGDLTAGSRIDVTEIAQTLNISVVPVREALIRLSERQFIQGGLRQNYHINRPSQTEQLDALTWARSLFQKAIEKFLLRDDRPFVISSIQAAASGNDDVPSSIFCYRLADALGKAGLSEIEYLLFSISLDSLLLAPPVECPLEYAELKTALNDVIDVIAGDGDIHNVVTKVSLISSIVEAIISLAHTQNAAGLIFKGS